MYLLNTITRINNNLITIQSLGEDYNEKKITDGKCAHCIYDRLFDG